MSTCRDLDQLSEAVADLAFRKSLQEGKVQEGVHRGVVRSKTVLVVAVVYGYLDTDTSIDEANDGSRYADKVGVPSVCGARKSKISS